MALVGEGSDEYATYGGALICVLSILMTLPIIMMDTLPGADFYQHAAIVSGLREMLLGGDPGLGHYTLQPSLYLLPYILALPLTAFMEPITALSGVLALAALLYPLSIVAILRARHQSATLALFALPFLYNSAFFWGFIAFQLSISLGFLAMAILLMPRPTPPQLLVLGALGALSALSHPYGPAMIIGLFALYSLVQRELNAPKALALLPSLGLLCGWALLGIHAEGHGGQWSYPGLWERLLALPEALGSVYVDGSSGLLLAAAMALIPGILIYHRATAGPFDAATTAMLLFAALNGGLYLILPEATEKTAFLNFRHALLGALLLPGALVMPSSIPLRRGLVAAGLALSVAASLTHISHLRAFDKEAAPIHRIARALPQNPGVVFLSFDPEGAILESHPHLHAGALIQATRGGLTLPDFPSLFWNLPLIRSTGPTLTQGVEWSPGRFRPTAPPEGMDFLLLRAPDVGELLPPLLDLGYQQETTAPPYYLLRMPKAQPITKEETREEPGSETGGKPGAELKVETGSEAGFLRSLERREE